jgi:toxoflavin synthase
MKKISQDKVTIETASMYDAGAKTYAGAAKRELREMTLHHSVVRHLGDLTDLRVLDIGCATGNSTRLSLDLGAVEVVGIDISAAEIEIARKTRIGENATFHVRSVSEDLTDLGTFDRATAILSMHYFASKQDMATAFANVKNSLNKGGEFYGVVIPLVEYEGYGVKIESPTGREGEASTFEVRDFQGNFILKMADIYWSQRTYEAALESAGFDVEWLPCLVSVEGIRKYGEAFWAEFIRNPLYRIWRAK